MNQTLFKSKPALLILGFLSLLAILFLLFAFTTGPRSAAPKSTSNNSNSTTVTGPPAKLALVADQASLSAGQTLTVTILVDSASNPINVVQANLTFPVDKLQFANTDSSTSAFSIEAENTAAGGVVKIARGTIKPVTGAGLQVAKVSFTVLQTVSASEVRFRSDSVVARSTDNKNILKLE